MNLNNDTPNVEVQVTDLPGIPSQQSPSEKSKPSANVFDLESPPQVQPKMKEDSVIDTLNPQDQQNKAKWESDLDAYIAREPDFLYRCENSTLASDDVFIICQTLEDSGEDGMSFDVFCAKLRLLEEDVVDLAEKYPRIEKSIRLSRVRRKGMQIKSMVLGGHRSAATMRTLFESEKINKDLLQVKEEEETKKITSVDALSKRLMSKGLQPSEYTSIVYLTGDLPNVDDPQDATQGMKQINPQYLTPKEVFDEMEKREKGNRKSTPKIPIISLV